RAQAVQSPSARCDGRAGFGRRLGRLVAVAEAANRLERELGAELSAQVANVDLHLVRRHAVGVPPDELEQLITAQDLTRVSHERGEKLELERRQRNVSTVERHGALGEV